MFPSLPRPSTCQLSVRRPHRADPPKPHAVCFVQAVRLPARRPRPICAHAASLDRSTGPPCAIIRRFITARKRGCPPEQWPALLAAVTDLDGAMTGILRTWLDRHRPAKAPSPIRAARWVISSATACASACLRHPRGRRRHRDHTRAEIRTAASAHGRRTFGQPSCRSRPRRRLRGSISRATTTSPASEPPIILRERADARYPRARARLW